MTTTSLAHQESTSIKDERIEESVRELKKIYTPKAIKIMIRNAPKVTYTKGINTLSPAV